MGSRSPPTGPGRRGSTTGGLPKALPALGPLGGGSVLGTAKFRNTWGAPSGGQASCAQLLAHSFPRGFTPAFLAHWSEPALLLLGRLLATRETGPHSHGAAGVCAVPCGEALTLSPACGTGRACAGGSGRPPNPDRLGAGAGKAAHSQFHAFLSERLCTVCPRAAEGGAPRHASRPGWQATNAAGGLSCPPPPPPHSTGRHPNTIHELRETLFTANEQRHAGEGGAGESQR